MTPTIYGNTPAVILTTISRRTLRLGEQTCVNVSVQRATLNMNIMVSSFFFFFLFFSNLLFFGTRVIASWYNTWL